MNDRQIESLVRMVAEIEELERAACSTVPRVGGDLRLVHGAGSERDSQAGHRWRVRRLVRLSPLLAAAACVGLAVVFATRGPTPVADPGSVTPVAVEQTRESPSAGTGTAGGPVGAPRAVHAAITPDQFRDWLKRVSGANDVVSGLLSIVQDSSGHFVCVHFKEHDFGGRRFEELTPEELVKATYEQRCHVVGPHTVIALALRGTRENLPDSAERAQAMAQCIVNDGSIALCAVETPMYDDAATNCVPPVVEVRSGALAMQ